MRKKKTNAVEFEAENALAIVETKAVATRAPALTGEQEPDAIEVEGHQLWKGRACRLRGSSKLSMVVAGFEGGQVVCEWLTTTGEPRKRKYSPALLIADEFGDMLEG